MGPRCSLSPPSLACPVGEDAGCQGSRGFRLSLQREICARDRLRLSPGRFGQEPAGLQPEARRGHLVASGSALIVSGREAESGLVRSAGVGPGARGAACLGRLSHDLV